MTNKIIPILPESPKPRDPMDTVCEFKWNYPIFQIDRGEFRSCCRTPSYTVTEEELQAKGHDAFLNSDRLKQSRLDLINGVRHDDCGTCWGLEDKGMTSPRIPENFWNFMRRSRMIEKEDLDKGYDTDIIRTALAKVTSIDHRFLNANRPYMLELSLGNTCDMKCMYCNHHYSSQWATEMIKNGEITQEQYDRELPTPAPSFEPKFWEWFDKVGRLRIHRVNIIGGEPLIIPKFYEYIELMKEKMTAVKHLPFIVRPTLCIVTNLNTPANYFNRFMDRLEAFTEVFDIEILISAESLGDRAEYIRNGVDWQRFESNINKLFSRKDVKFTVGFLMSVNVLSIATTKEFVQWATELSKKYDRTVHFKQNIVNHPSWQAPLLLPPEFAKYLDNAIEYMEQHVDSMPIATDYSGRYDQYIIFLKSLSDTMKNNTADYTADRRIFGHWYKQFDDKRNLNFDNSFPEYVEFSSQCRKL
jgi:hypothetical protein